MSAYDEFNELVKDIYRLGALQGHLGWDQETIMPPKGAEVRGEILAWLAKERHSRIVDSNLGQLLTTLEAETGLNADQNANIREMRREYDKSAKLPSDFVSQFAKTRSQALLSWQKARSNSDFSLFEPHLQKLVDMTRQKIDYYGIKTTAYDVLLDEYEVAMTVTDYDPLFAGLKEKLVPLLQKILNSQKLNPQQHLPDNLTFPISQQTKFCEKVSLNMGFDFEAGRMDASTHPFSAGLWPGDTRFTTRFDEKDPFSCLYAVMHETGHALYEQGLASEFAFTPRGQAVSLGVHESQSRLWENQIGRTEAFWQVALPWFRELFPDCPQWDAKQLNKIANKVSTGFIRVEADEVTYNLHVMIRYEIEKMLFNGDLTVKQLPQAWNSMFEQWFGIKVPDDSMGCLQDIHWSMAAFGYFPTYTLGNLYAAQLLESMSADLGDIDQIIADGDWSSLLQWLRPRIHQQGSVMTPTQLIESATGKAPSPDAFIRYIESKYSELYSLDKN